MRKKGETVLVEEKKNQGEKVTKTLHKRAYGQGQEEVRTLGAWGPVLRVGRK